VGRVQAGNRDAGHLYVESAVNRGGGVVSTPPVGDGRTFESPFVTEYLLDEFPMLAHQLTSNTVVRSHHRADTGVDGCSERGQVHLAQRPLVDDDVDPIPVPILVVGDEVFGRHGNVPGLHSSEIGRAQFRCQPWIFAQVLEVATGGRDAGNVQSRCQ